MRSHDGASDAGSRAEMAKAAPEGRMIRLKSNGFDRGEIGEIAMPDRAQAAPERGHAHGTAAHIQDANSAKPNGHGAARATRLAAYAATAHGGLTMTICDNK